MPHYSIELQSRFSSLTVVAVHLVNNWVLENNYNRTWLVFWDFSRFQQVMLSTFFQLTLIIDNYTSICFSFAWPAYILAFIVYRLQLPSIFWAGFNRNRAELLKNNQHKHPNKKIFHHKLFYYFVMAATNKSSVGLYFLPSGQ